MISVLANWLYMAIITYLTGSLCLFVFGIRECALSQNIIARILTGVLFVTGYAQIVSLFGPLSLWANVGLLCIAVLSAIRCRRFLLVPLQKPIFRAPSDLPETLGGPTARMKKILTIFFILFFTLLFALCTAGPTRQFDTNYYHAQTIHWLEEYGAVKGAANLFYPLANNSAGHYFDAVFSMKFLTGRSLHTAGGFLGLLIFLHGLFMLMQGRSVTRLFNFIKVYFRKHKENMSDDLGLSRNIDRERLQCKNQYSAGLGLAEMVYAIIMTAYYADPYTDILPNVLVFFVISEWIIGMTKKDEDIKSVALLSVLALFAAVCKLTVWPIALLMFVPLIQSLKKRNWKFIFGILGASLFILLPTFATNAIISGYILYPVYFLDFLNVPWKLDIDVLKWNVSSAVEFARLRTTDPLHPLNTGFSWLPFWFEKQATLHQVLYAYVLILFGADVMCSVRKLLRGVLSVFDRKMLLLRAVCYITLVYWFFTMPELRFVWSFVLTIIAMLPASIESVSSTEDSVKEDLGKKSFASKESSVKASSLNNSARKVFPLPVEERQDKHCVIREKVPLFLWGVGLAFFLLYAALYGFRTFGYARGGFENALVLQADYDRREGKTVEIGGHLFVNEIIGEPYVCGYYLFPYYENESTERELITGDDIRDGFYFVK